MCKMFLEQVSDDCSAQLEYNVNIVSENRAFSQYPPSIRSLKREITLYQADEYSIEGVSWPELNITFLMNTVNYSLLILLLSSVSASANNSSVSSSSSPQRRIACRNSEMLIPPDRSR